MKNKVLDTPLTWSYALLCIGLDKSGYQVNIFLFSPRKLMLCVLIRSASPEVPW